MLLWIF
jgi:hypothetical protein